MSNPAQLSIWNLLLSSIADEMGIALWRTGHSPNIRERKDFSCALFDIEGGLVAQAAHIPVHLGAMPEAIKVISRLAPWDEGDIVILNDPYLGGTHLPDITLVSPVFSLYFVHIVKTTSDPSPDNTIVFLPDILVLIVHDTGRLTQSRQ